MFCLFWVLVVLFFFFNITLDIAFNNCQNPNSVFSVLFPSFCGKKEGG